jgi:hypothetical protein
MDAWADLAATFRSAKLPVPPVPEAMRDRLRSPEKWCWTTGTATSSGMYMDVFEYLDDVLAGRVDEEVSVSHGGHGVNSYAITLHLVHANLAVVTQLFWGGIYTDNAKATQRVAEVWRRCGALLERVDPAAPDRVVVLLSGRVGSACARVPRAGGSLDAGQLIRDQREARYDPFDVAEALLNGAAPGGTQGRR